MQNAICSLLHMTRTAKQNVGIRGKQIMELCKIICPKMLNKFNKNDGKALRCPTCPWRKVNRCLCWTICLLFLLIVAIGVSAAILYAVFQPKLPNYSVDKLQITQFNLGSDSSLSATFDVTITATNPNKKIGIYYEGGSSLRVYYTNTQLCQGSMPKFYQGHQNTTVLILPLTGQIQDGNALVTALREQQQQAGNIPLNLKVNQPVRVKLGKLKLMKVKFLVSCRLVVDALSANSAISIQSSSCKFKFRL
ncbi:hypothetical protein SLEP1_g12935 [Rubroshorea leprosula]|uniref:Late embryogenesis abundant protein LEA-2 subgroup domain-containing protein n=1 Tax=Rubroshorea leprosula TaxID=152421 RepID=A0AAV5IE47_9ROSI|nr:hypothetical protein SLEP1_g12935 [Rubroshorea leprosula]